MSVILFVRFEVPHRILTHEDVWMHIRLDHVLQMLWILLQEELVEHDTSIVDYDARSLAAIREKLSVGARCCLAHIERHDFCLDIWVQIFRFLCHFLKLVD